VTLIALLRAAGYRFPLIAQALDELAAGNPEQVRRALESRLAHLDEASANCLAASAALHHYMSAWEDPPIPDPLPQLHPAEMSHRKHARTSPI
jgi:hypothetical protein